jgi:hypothetical protein
MKAKISILGSMIMALALGAQAHAAVFSFQVGGGPISASGWVNVVPDVSPPDPNPLCGTTGNDPCRSDPVGAYMITSITGTFTDTNLGINDAAITGLIPISPADERDPLLGNPFDPLVPSSLSFLDANPVDILDSNFLSYNNLFFPDGSPIDCAFPFTGTFVDPFGMAFNVAGGYRADIWGDGDFPVPGSGTTTYGAGVMTSGGIVDYQFAGLSGSAAPVPEPSSWLLMLIGFGALGFASRRARLVHKTATRHPELITAAA